MCRLADRAQKIFYAMVHYHDKSFQIAGKHYLRCSLCIPGHLVDSSCCQNISKSQLASHQKDFCHL